MNARLERANNALHTSARSGDVAERVAVLDSVVVVAAPLADIGRVAGAPGLVVKTAVLADAGAVLEQDVRVVELARHGVAGCGRVGNGINILYILAEIRVQLIHQDLPGQCTLRRTCWRQRGRR